MIMTSQPEFQRTDVSQESQYAFPYHYIPSFENGHFSQHLCWSWGYRYLGGMDVVLSYLVHDQFESLADIGCGDGRFLREVSSRFPGNRLLGVDCSERAINLAKAMNPDLDYACADICSQEEPPESFDVVTLIEVLEHIPVEDVDDFVSAFSRYVKPDGRLILTVPHTNKSVQAKHYQHFDSESLTKVVEPYYKVERVLFFDKKSRVFGRIMNSVLGNWLFILNNRFLLDFLYRTYRKYYFFCSEAKCSRICLVGRKK